MVQLNVQNLISPLEEAIILIQSVKKVVKVHEAALPRNMSLPEDSLRCQYPHHVPLSRTPEL